MITPKIEMSSITIEEISKLDTNTKIMICKVIAYNMIAIHIKRIIHADIKPNNVLIKKTITGTYTAKLLISTVAILKIHYRRLTTYNVIQSIFRPKDFCTYVRKQKRLPQKADICFGESYFVNILPEICLFDTEKYTYLYAAILDESDICIKNNIPEEIKLVLLKMLSKNPEERPSIQKCLILWLSKTKMLRRQHRM